MMKNKNFLKKFSEFTGAIMDSSVAISEESSYGTPLLVLPTNDIQTVIKFIQKDPTFVYTFMVDVLRDGIENDRDKVEFFRIGETDGILEVSRENFSKSLENMKGAFIEAEMYEYAGICNTLLDKYHVNMLLRP